MSWQRSTAMMSAPSSANRTAWLRPWPRAAPVTNATFPCTRPTCRCPFLCVSAAVDAQNLSGDVAGFFGDQECTCGRDVLGLADAPYRCRLDVLLDDEVAAFF